MPVIICLAGPSGPGKDALLEGLAAKLGQTGLKVGVIKDSLPQEPASAGQRPMATASFAQGRLVVEQREEEISLLQIAERFMPEADLVISAANSHEKKAKLEYCPEGEPAMLKDPGLRALVGPVAGGDKPVFAEDDLEGLAKFVQDNMMPKKELPRARVLIAGRNLPMKGFVQDIVADTIRAMVGSLRGGDKPGRMEVYID